MCIPDGGRKSADHKGPPEPAIFSSVGLSRMQMERAGTETIMYLSENAESRDYDRLLQRAAEQMTAAARPPDLTVAAQAAGVPLEQARSMFANDRALAAMVLQQQMVLLTDFLTRRALAAPADDLVAQIRAAIYAYVDWFLENPGTGRLLISPPAMVAASEEDVRRFSSGVYDFVHSMLERARDRGLIRPDINIADAMLTMRALTLGSVVLHEMGHARLWGGQTDPRQALHRILDEYFDLATQHTPA